MRYIHAIAAITTLTLGAFTLTLWASAELPTAGITGAIAGTAGLVWGYCDFAATQRWERETRR